MHLFSSFAIFLAPGFSEKQIIMPAYSLIKYNFKSMECYHRLKTLEKDVLCGTCAWLNIWPFYAIESLGILIYDR